MHSNPGARHDFLRRWQVPLDWEVRTLGSLASILGGGTPKRGEGRFWHGGAVPWATPTDVTDPATRCITRTAERITEAGLAASAGCLLPVGSILYTSRATIGAKAIAGVPIATNQGFANFVPRAVDGEYLYYMLELLRPAIGRLASGTTFAEVSKRDIKSVWCALPATRDEQTAIVRALAAVDDAVAHCRTAAHAAHTLKRSLMHELLPPWIGLRQLGTRERPIDVEDIVRADAVADVGNGSTPSRADRRYWRRGEIPWLATGKVHDRVITEADEYVTDVALRECSIRLFPPGTVLLAMIGQGRTRGMAAYLDITACINQNFGAFAPKSDATPRVWGKWLFYFLDRHYASVRELGSGTNQGALNCYLLKRLRLPLPPLERQEEVARILDGVEAVELAHEATTAALLRLRNSLARELLTGHVRVATGVAEARHD
jgi:type I restriction enzyme, S subunit